MVEKLLSSESLKKDLEKLVSFPTVTGQNNGFDEAFSFIKDQVRKDAIVTILENEGERIFLASNHDTKTPDILYLVHVDVVSANKDQFTLSEEKGFVFGRGVIDMKFSIPIGWALLNSLIQEKSKLNFSFAVTSDEERGGFKGAAFLAEAYGLRPELVIVPDGGNEETIINKSKGVCHILVNSKGISAHASRPWEGKNAVEPIVVLLKNLLTKYGKNNRKETWKTTMNIGIIKGGESINQVCPEAEVQLDFRIPETTTPDKILEEVIALSKRISPNLKADIIARGEPSFTDPKDPKFLLYIKIMEKHLGTKIKVRGAYGSSDVRHFSKLGIPFLMNMPRGDGAHSKEEWLDLDSAIEFYNALEEFLREYEKKIS